MKISAFYIKEISLYRYNEPEGPSTIHSLVRSNTVGLFLITLVTDI